MRRTCAVVALLWSLFVFLEGVPAEAITFSSQGADGGSTAPAPVVTGSGAPRPASGKRNAAPLVLPLDKESKGRMGEAISLVQATGFQAKLAMMELERIEEQGATTAEIAARLDHAYKSFEAMEKAAKGLDDTVKLTRLALEGHLGPKERLAALADLFAVLPAEAFDDMSSMATQAIQNEIGKIAGGARLTYEKALSTLSSGAKAVGDFASKAKNAVKSGFDKVVGTLTTPVAYAHTKVSQVVGWEGWAKTMAVTKFACTVTVGTAGLVVAITTLPATAVAAPLVAVGVYTATNIGAGLSLVNDLNEIDGRSSPGLESSSYAISKTTAVIGLVQGGSPGEILVNVIGGSMDDMTVGREMTPAEVDSFVKEQEEKMERKGLHVPYRPPADRTPSGGGGDNGGGGSGGGCGDGCS
ncbi:MAG: hypothetical protein JMJ93_08560 [Synergistaceae bacterium]|nr:hypothetical protein [Synergistaceae bacterium]